VGISPPILNSDVQYRCVDNLRLLYIETNSPTYAVNGTMTVGSQRRYGVHEIQTDACLWVCGSGRTYTAGANSFSLNNIRRQFVLRYFSNLGSPRIDPGVCCLWLHQPLCSDTCCSLPLGRLMIGIMLITVIVTI
jgi:hypothetical protein